MAARRRPRARVSFAALQRFQRGFESKFEDFRERYRNMLAMALAHQRNFVIGFLAVVVLSFALVPLLGSNFFPDVDAGQIALHVRPPVGTRIENASATFGDIEQQIRQVIPPDELATIVDNIGLPTSSINTHLQQFRPDRLPGRRHLCQPQARSSCDNADYVRELRERLPHEFPGAVFSFLPADIVSQILNFGTPSPIDVQITGPRIKVDQALALNLLRRLRTIRGIADPRMQQSLDNPQLKVDVDRARMAQFGLNELNVTNALATSLAGSSQTAPTFWLDPKSGVSYPIVAQTPEYHVDSLSGLENVPITARDVGPQVLGGLGNITRQTRARSSRITTSCRRSIFMPTTQDRDLGGVDSDIRSHRSGTSSRTCRAARRSRCAARSSP